MSIISEGFIFTIIQSLYVLFIRVLCQASHFFFFAFAFAKHRKSLKSEGWFVAVKGLTTKKSGFNYLHVVQLSGRAGLYETWAK